MKKATFWKNNNTLHESNYPSDISFTVKEIASRKFPNYDDFTWEDMNYKRVYNGGCFIHNTQISRLEGILKEGLDMSSKNVSYKSNPFLWAVNPEVESLRTRKPIKDIWTGYGGTSIIFHVPEGIFVEQLNADQYGIWGRIPPEYIDSVDIPVFWDDYGETYRLSDLKELAIDSSNSDLGKTPMERLDSMVAILEKAKFHRFSDKTEDMEKLLDFVRENLR